jgi:hypothetical protein
MTSIVKLRANTRRLDRLNIKVTSVLAAMRRGEALHMEFAWYGRVWCLSGGRRIDNEVAQVVIKNARVADVGDALFSNAPAQTWRWVE